MKNILYDINKVKKEIQQRFGQILLKAFNRPNKLKEVRTINDLD